MIFFFFGRPSALFMYQTSLTWVSFASEPELAKNARVRRSGVIATRRSARSIAGLFALPENEW
jgi:hypothetical protein